MGKFDKINTDNKFKAVAKASEEKANVIQIKYISGDNLVDYPRNNEDLSYTADLENSMKENGFTDPLEVTAFGMDEGKFLIVSGNRRRAAGEKAGYTTFPCIIKTFNNEHDVHNYVLSSNSHRNAVSDPLLYCKRYKMHEEYLKEVGFKGSFRDEISKRLGISTQQADRYNKFNNVILPVWDLVRNEIVGMSSVMPMASRSLEVQEEILTILNECIEQGEELTRPTCSKIFKAYDEGLRSYIEIFQADLKDFPDVLPESNQQNNVVDINRGRGVSVVNVDPEPTQNEAEVKSPLSRNDEVNYQGYEQEFESKPGKNESRTETTVNDNKDKRELSDTEKKLIEGENLGKLLIKVEEVLHKYYSFHDADSAKSIIETMKRISITLFEEMESITGEYKLDEADFKNSIDEIIKTLETYK